MPRKIVEQIKNRRLQMSDLEGWARPIEENDDKKDKEVELKMAGLQKYSSSQANASEEAS